MIEKIKNYIEKLNEKDARIAELEEEIELDKSIIHNQHELIKSGERRGEEKAKQRIAELEAECRNSYNEGISVGEKERLRLGGRILELEATVEQLRCCGNCTHFMIDDRRALYCENEVYPFPIFGKCETWEGR